MIEKLKQRNYSDQTKGEYNSMKQPERKNLLTVYANLKDKELYYVTLNSTQLYVVEPCFLKYNSYKDKNKTTYFTLIPFRNGYKENYSHLFDWKYLYETKEEANKIVEEKNSKLKSFRHLPFLKDECLEQHYKKLKEIEDQIDGQLSQFEDYDGVDFCDVSAGGIQVRLHHKKIKGYTYGEQKTIKYDFSNAADIPAQVIKEFIDINNEEDIQSMKKFIRFGEKYGWD